MTRRESGRRDGGLPRLAAALLRSMLPHAEREEVLWEIAEEHRSRVVREGRWRARGWVWRQVLASAPALVRRGWWRGWSGFEPRANRWQPGGAMLESWGRDLRFAARRLARRPTYAGLAVLTLALGVAGTVAVFGIVKGMLIEPLPVRAESDVVVFWAEGGWSEREFLALRPEIRGFASLAAFGRRDVTLQRGDAPARLIEGTAATAELFAVLGAEPLVGPGFRAGDDRPGAEPVAVLSHGFWRELGGDPGIVGEQIELGGVQRTVVGVMPAGFWFPDPTVRVWLSNQLNEEDGSGNWGLIGRLGEGTSVQAMGPELDRVMAVMDERFNYPEGQWDKTVSPELTPLRDYLVGSVRPALLATLAAMVVILLIACVNVAALMLGQVDSRETELAVRAALGAGRQRLLRGIVLESVVLGTAAGLLGAVMARVLFPFVAGALPLGALAEAATVDWTVFWASMATALVAATAVSLAPGISLARSDLRGRLTRSRTGGIGGRGGRMESALVVAQVALVVVMVAGAALLIRSVANLRAIDPGVSVDGVAVVDVMTPTTLEASRRPQVIQEMVQAVEALPGVASAAVTQRLPLRGSSDNWGIDVEGRPELESTTTAFRIVSPGYFETLGIPLLRGRTLEETDRAAAAGEGAVVINEELAARYFPGEDPIGRRISFMDRWDRIVGVVGNAAEAGLSPDPVPARYMTYEQVPWHLPGQTMVIRMREGASAAGILDDARRAIQAVAPGVAIQEQTTMRNVFARAIGPALQVMSLLALLGSLALTLGAIGVYGVVSHFVTRRRRDWGIRLALGLHPRRIVGQIVAQGGLLVASGAVLGVVAFLALARLLASLVYGVGTADPPALLSAICVMLAAGVLAAYVPARRASRIDPALVLREE